LRDWRLYAPFADIRNDPGPFRGLFRCAQSQDSSASPQSGPQDSAPPAETKKPKKVWTNDDVPRSNGGVSVVGGPKEQAEADVFQASGRAVCRIGSQAAGQTAGQVADIDKQLVDLKNFSEGEPSTSASGMKLNKSYDREPIEVQSGRCGTRRKTSNPKSMRSSMKPARKASNPAN